MAADRARSTLSKMFAWAIGGALRVEPGHGHEQAERGEGKGAHTGRPRAGHYLEPVPGNDYGHIVRLLMLTAQRRDEIGGLLAPKWTPPVS